MKRIYVLSLLVCLCLSTQLEAMPWGTLSVSSLKLALNAMYDAKRSIEASVPEAPEGYEFLFDMGIARMGEELDQIHRELQVRNVDLSDAAFSYSQEDLNAVITLLKNVIDTFGAQNEDVHAQLMASVFALIMASLRGQHGGVAHHAEFLRLRDDYADLADAYLQRAQMLYALQQRREFRRHPATLEDLVTAAQEDVRAAGVERFFGLGGINILGPDCG